MVLIKRRNNRLFKALTPEEEKRSRAWARANWKMGQDVNTIWHPVVRAEIAQMQAEYPAILAAAMVSACGRGIQRPVVEALSKAWYDQAAEILGQLQDHGGYWAFNRWGMYVGVEPDGYIHT